MIILRSGDRLPTVAVLQSHLNQQEALDRYIEVDGIFGAETRRAVVAVQRALGTTPTGIVEYGLWRQVVGHGWQIIDSVDRSDHDSPDHRILDHEDLAPFGQTVLEQFGMSMGTPLVLRSVRESARDGQVVLLRFHGHGSPGSMLVSSGRIGAGSSLDHRYGDGFYEALRALRPIFAPFGSVEMHGCRVGRGGPGHSLLSRMANALGVPASGAHNSQYGGGVTTYRFEGATRTECPGGIPLKQWAGEVATVSVPEPRGP